MLRQRIAMDRLIDARAERALVGSVLIDPAAWRRVSRVPAEALTDWKRRAVWEAASKIMKEGRKLDYVTLCDRLEKDGVLDDVGTDYVAGLATAVPSALHVEEYAEAVLDRARRRDDVRRAEELVTLAYNSVEDYAVERARIAREVLTDGTGKRGLVGAYEAVEEAFREVEHNMDNPLKAGEVRYLSTGLVDLDRVTGGLHPGLYSVAGVTNCGKTALALTISLNAARAGKRVVYVSPEMSPGELMHRAICAYAHVTSEAIEKGSLTPEEMSRVYETFGWLSELPLVISQETSVSAIDALLYQWLPIDFIVIDGVELLEGAKSERTHEAKGELARWAKALAENPDIKAPVWLPMQISAHGLKHRDDKRPRPGDVYGSAEPEMFSDNVLLLHRPDYWDPDSHTNTVELGYWKSRKRHRELPAFCEFLLDAYGAVRDIAPRSTRELEEPYWYD